LIGLIALDCRLDCHFRPVFDAISIVRRMNGLIVISNAKKNVLAGVEQQLPIVLVTIRVHIVFNRARYLSY